MDLSKLDLSEEQMAAVNAAVEAEVSGLKAKNSELLGKQTALNAKFDGIDIDAINKMIADSKSAQEADMLKNGQFSELLNMKMSEQTAQSEAQINAYKLEADKAKTELTTVTKQLNQNALDNFIRSGADQVKDLHQSSMTDLLARAGSTWKMVDGKHQAFDGDNPILKDGAPISADAWIETMRESAPHFFNKANGVGGLGGSGGGDNLLKHFQKDTMNYTEQAKIAKENPEQYKQLQEQAAATG